MISSQAETTCSSLDGCVPVFSGLHATVYLSPLPTMLTPNPNVQILSFLEGSCLSTLHTPLLSPSCHPGSQRGVLRPVITAAMSLAFSSQVREAAGVVKRHTALSHPPRALTLTPSGRETAGKQVRVSHWACFFSMKGKACSGIRKDSPGSNNAKYFLHIPTRIVSPFTLETTPELPQQNWLDTTCVYPTNILFYSHSGLRGKPQAQTQPFGNLKQQRGLPDPRS